MAPKLADLLQKCKSIDDVVDAFISVGFNRAHEIDSKRKALSITPTGGDFLNIIISDKPPTVLQPPEKRAGVCAALYVSEDFRQYKFFLTKLIFGREPSYSFTTRILKSSTQLGNLARVKINSLKYDNLNSVYDVVETSSEQAIRNFEENLGAIIESLRREIKHKVAKNPTLEAELNEVSVVFSKFMGPEFDQKALIELLIQHLLTKDIFAAAYGETARHNDVVVASLESLTQRFDDIPILINDKHELRERRESVIQVIELNPIEKRLEIIKLVYEAFYSVYNPLDADRLGIVYTPKAAVDFIIHSTDKLISKHLQINIADKNIHIMDPCIGTGTFMISLLDYMNSDPQVSKKTLISKYVNELHANEVSILAYNIAAINVKRLFKSITGQSKPFSGIVCRDTLLTLNLDNYSDKGSDNFARIKAQQQHKIMVILGNPPYNAGQKNFGDGNPNPAYFSTYGGVDDRISETYHKKSQFKKQTRDMYKRFIRWASDRIGDRGIIGFISNNSFIHANNYDGMRACLAEEFDFIYICDLRGNANTRGEKRKKEGGGFFGKKSKVGIAVYFLIKTGECLNSTAKIYYADIGDYKTQKQKIAWLENRTIDDLTFVQITPGPDYNWVGEPVDMNYRRFVPLVSFKTKQGKTSDAIFQLFTNGIKTGADDWQTDFEPKTLAKKIVLYAKEYNRIRQLCAHDSSKVMQHTKKSAIPWYSGLDRKARANKVMKFNSANIFPTTYRPFVNRYFYYDNVVIQAISKWPSIIQQDTNIPVICVRARSPHKFECVGTIGFADHVLILHSQNIPLFKLNSNGKWISNLTDYGRNLFCAHYEKSDIGDEDIFYYCYAVLNDPVYVKKYEYETRTLHPRIPLHPKFYNWSSIGKDLFKLHSNFKQQPKYQLHKIHESGDSTKFILNLTPSSSETWKARIDGALSIDGIPAKAADPKSNGYVIGARTPIGWVLEYYQKACKASNKTKVPTQMASLKFEKCRNDIIDLVYRLCTVSLTTIKLQGELSKLPHSFVPCTKLCCKSLSVNSPSKSKKCLQKRHVAQNRGQRKI